MAPATNGTDGRRGISAIGLFAHYWKAAAGVLVLTLLSTVLGSVEPLLQKYFFDALAGTVFANWTPEKLILALLAGMVSLAVFSELLSFCSNTLTWWLRLRVNYRLLDVVVSHIYSLSLSYHQRETIASLRTRIDRGANGISQVMFDVSFGVLPSVIYLACTVFFMVHLSPRLSMIALFFAPLPAIIGIFSGRIASERERVLTLSWSRIFGRLDQTLSLFKTVKSFRMERPELRRFLGEVDSTNAVVARGIRIDSLFGAAKNLSLAFGRFAVLGYGAVLLLHHQLTIGTLVAFMMYAGGLSAPVIGLAGAYEAYKKGRVYMGMLREILDTPQDVADSPNARTLTDVAGRVAFRDVRFGYRGDRQVLQGVSFDVPAGATVALVGPSGSGKTTIIDLLNRFYDVNSGAVLVDDLDVRAVTQESLRAQLGMVLQDTALFNDTITANIAIAKPEATQEEILAVARAANADAFIQKLPQGYDTVVGDRGSWLSGGERQRVAIARALLKDPPILVFDEASSNLDSQSEASVQEAIELLRGKKTLFIIAHRLSTIRNADLILVVENGRVVEQGKHSELLAAGGTYARLVALQSLEPAGAA